MSAPKPELKAYTIEAWWNVVYHSTRDVLAASPEDAMAQLEALDDEGDNAFFESSESCDTPSDTNLEVYEGGFGKHLLGKPSPAYRLEEAAPQMLAALKVLTLASRIVEYLEANDPKALVQAQDAIREAEGS